MINPQIISCHSCDQKFPDYKSLALHIVSSKKGHRKGKGWAAKYIQKSVLVADKKQYGQAPMTEEQKESLRDAKEDIRRVLSGNTKSVIAKCPKCKNNHRKLLEEEFAGCPEAWKLDGLIATSCPSCVR